LKVKYIRISSGQFDKFSFRHEDISNVLTINITINFLLMIHIGFDIPHDRGEFWRVF